MIPNIRLYLYLAILIGVASWAVYERHHLIQEGEQIKVAEYKRGADKQKAIDDKTLKDAADAHAKEMDNLRKLYGGGGEFNVVHYNLPGKLPAAPLPMGECPAGGVVQEDKRLYSDRERALEMFASIGDRLSADCRELNRVTH